MFQKNALWIFKILFSYLALCIALFLMLRTSLSYLSFQDDNQFLAFKQDYLNNSLWKSAFYIHVFSAFISLFAGFTQFSSELLNQHKKFHRIFGHIYVWTILAINFPAGLVLAIYANGGTLGKAAFLTLDFLWFIFTFQALRFAIKGKFGSHRNFMIRSFALSFSAITLRSWKIILVQTTSIDLATIYIIDAWLGFLPNLIIAELIIRQASFTKILTLKGNRTSRHQ